MTRCIAGAIAVLLVLSLVLSACGGGDDAANDEPGTVTVDDSIESTPLGDEDSSSPASTADDAFEGTVPTTGPEHEEPAGAPAATTPPDDTAQPAAPADTSAEPEPDRWATTPLAPYWGYSYSSLADELEGLIEEGWREQELIATCMAEQGFEYVPWQWTSPAAFRAVSEPGLSAEDYREQYGYGISLEYGRTQDTQDDVSFVPPPDPNEEIRAGMSAGEREAFDRAMFGAAPRTEDTTLEEQGCQGQATIALYRVELALKDQLGEDRRTLRARIDNDSRVVQATKDWSRCMQEAGFFYTSADEIQGELYGRYAPFERRGDPGEVLTREEIEAMTPAELEALQAELLVLSPEEQAQLDALQDYELAVAAADYRCGLPLDDVRYEVTVELEQQFVDEHLATLEAIVASR